MNTNEVLDGLVNKILSDDDLPGTLMYSLFPLQSIPSSKWSFMNRLIMVYSGTHDARGYKQWQQVNRYVKKGSKAIWITAPLMRKVESDGELVPVITGFKVIPVYRLEDTDGEPLEYVDYLKEAEERIKQFPLMDVANSLGLTVVADLTRNGEGGSFGGDKIRMCNEDEETFFHELSHAVDKHLGNDLSGNYALSEVVAELSSACLATIYGSSVNLKFTREYIKGWSHGSPGKFVATALARVNSIVEYVHTAHEKAA